MKVEDVMTRNPVTVGPDAPLKLVARLLVTHRISGLPVVGAGGATLGVVSEADLIAKGAGPGPETPRGWRRRFVRARDAEAARRTARTAGEAMTSPALTIRPAATVAEAARAMTKNQVNRLPVVDDERKLCGIVTRADLVRTFLRSDEHIRQEIEQDVILRALATAPSRVSVRVSQGEVRLDGRLETEYDAELLPRLVERVAGVVSVSADLTWDLKEETRPLGVR